MSQHFQSRGSQRVHRGGTNQFTETPAVRRSGKKPKNPKRYSLLFFLFAAVGIFGLVRLIQSASQTYAVQLVHLENLALVSQTESASPAPSVSPEAADRSAKSTRSVISPFGATPTPAPTAAKTNVSQRPQMMEKYAALYEKNNDLIGWLDVNCLYRVNFAIVQGKNNFYMDHDFNRQENVNGAAFLDETSSVWPRDDNLIIYAHNMKSGEMFGELNLLQNSEKLNRNPFVSFDTLYEQGTYVPLAVFVCSVVQADDYFQFYVRNFRSESEFDEYVGRARELSSVRLKTDAQYGDQLLTLVTCYDQENRQRFVVLLRKLRDNETRDSVKAAFFK